MGDLSRGLLSKYEQDRLDSFGVNEDLIEMMRDFPFHKLNINFIEFSKFPIWNAPLHWFADPIIVQYRNGLLEILPKNLRHTSVKQYLGARSANIVLWGVVPGLNSSHNPFFDPEKRNVKTNLLELYDRIHERPN